MDRARFARNLDRAHKDATTGATPLIQNSSGIARWSYIPGSLSYSLSDLVDEDRFKRAWDAACEPLDSDAEVNASAELHASLDAYEAGRASC